MFQRAQQPPVRGEPRPQGGVRGALAQRHAGLLHHLPAALPAAQGQSEYPTFTPAVYNKARLCLVAG